MTMALLHSWVSIQESTPALGGLDSFKDNLENGLECSRSAIEGSATETRKCIPVRIPRNLEGNHLFFNEAITSHNKTRKIPHENSELLPSNSNLTNSQNNESLQLRRPMPDKEERQFDSNDKNTDILESRSNLADSYFQRGLYKKAMELFQQILEAHTRFLGDEDPDTLRVSNE